MQCTKTLALLVFVVSLLGTTSLLAQGGAVRGVIIDNQTGAPLKGATVKIEGTEMGTASDASGTFLLENLPGEDLVLLIEAEDHYYERRKIDDVEGTLDLGMIRLETNQTGSSLDAEDLIPTISLSDSDLDDNDLGVQNISGLLTASRDRFISAAAFTFGPRRFRIRGYDSENSVIYLNGVPMNVLENNRPNWASWSGLNDVTRNQNTTIDLSPVGFAFGNIGGATMIDARASKQRKQLRASYSLSNRSYVHRLMATYSTGSLPGGWAISVSGSKRWAEEGYVEGTSYDAYAYFAAIEKQLNDKHSLNLTFLGSYVERGRGLASTKEMYDIAGDNYYNPWWGYQNGEKRNARTRTQHQPMTILTHDWKITPSSSLMTAVSYQTGRNGTLALNWIDADNPYPDYYRRLPSYHRSLQDEFGDKANDEFADLLEQQLRESKELRQIDWDNMYYQNQNSSRLVENVNNTGEDMVLNTAQYLVEDRRFDSDQYNFSTVYENVLSDEVKLNGGVNYQVYIGDNYKLVDDLLGAEYHYDIDKFAERDSAQNPDFYQPDLNNPNRVVKEGDRFEYDFATNIHKGAAWLQTEITTRYFDFFAGAELSNTRFWRTGRYRNGKAPDNSFGDSEEQQFTNYAFKGGVTYKINGRNYIYANGSYLTRAPTFRNSFVSERVRNHVLPNLTDEKITALEGGYVLKSPYAKARVTGYYTTFRDQIWKRNVLVITTSSSDEEVSDFLGDELGAQGDEGGFGALFMPQLNETHIGLEVAAEFRIATGLDISAVAAIGEYVYDSNPELLFSIDNNPDEFAELGKVYLKNFYVPGLPQNAFTLGLHYNSAQYWFANLNFNYMDQVYLDIFPLNRTVNALSTTLSEPQYVEQVVEPGSPLWEDIINQKRGAGAFSIDFFGGKSWKIDDVFIYLNVGVNNILDDKEYITGGFEQFQTMGQRVSDKDPNLRAPNVWYGFGRNYFIGLSVRI